MDQIKCTKISYMGSHVLWFAEFLQLGFPSNIAHMITFGKPVVRTLQTAIHLPLV